MSAPRALATRRLICSERVNAIAHYLLRVTYGPISKRVVIIVCSATYGREKEE